MKLRNKKTGEIYNFKISPDYDDVMSGWKIENKDFGVRYYSHLAELSAEWEDYEEPKEYWYIESDGSIIQNHKPTYINHLLDGLKSIGNYFDTLEEAEQAVEKLKAWKRLKDKGFEFVGLSYSSSNEVYFEFVDEPLLKEQAIEAEKDLDLLFGGES